MIFAVAAFTAFAAFWLILGMEIGRYQRDKAYNSTLRRMNHRNDTLVRENTRLTRELGAVSQELDRVLTQD